MGAREAYLASKNIPFVLAKPAYNSEMAQGFRASLSNWV